MNKDTELTKVVFRKWKDNGSIIAFFPEERFTHARYTCMSYEHIGQHGEASYSGLLSLTKLAKPNEYKALKRELEGLGYNLKVIKKYVRNKNE